ncbi:hypothetical protein PSPO01_01806 [Paraphaeosphaeria sporulosa]
MVASPMSASMRAHDSFSTNGMGPNVPQILQQMNIKGFHDFLVGRLLYLSQEAHWRLKSDLDLRGWPLHLRSMDDASWQLEAGAPWAPEDQKSLMVLSAHGVKAEDIAEQFFEGRTVDECQVEIDAIKAGVPMNSIETGQGAADIDIGASKAASPETPSTKAILSGLAKTPWKPTSFINRLIEVSSGAARARSDTPHADSRKDWNQADRDTVWAAVQRGMSPRQIQEKYLPFRSESAIQTRMTKERKLRGVQAIPTKWSNRDNELVIKLVDEGHDFEDIAPRLSRERTPKQIEARYRNLKKQARVSRMSVEVNVIDDDEDVELGDDNMQVDADGDEGSEYNDEISRVVQTPHKPKTTRKTIPYNSSEKSPTKKPPSSITSIRTKLLNSIDAKYLDSDGKKGLRKALNKTGWPTRFTSVEEHDSPMPEKNGPKWPTKDVEALRCIRETAPSIPYKKLEEFFPGRSQTAIRNIYNTRANPSPNYSDRKK